MKDVISVAQFSDRELLGTLFKAATRLQTLALGEYPKPLHNLTLATIFYEPSTRTRLSFETAIQNLGGQLITTENAGEFSSAIKGESLEDTIRVINSYADGIVLRHPEVGAAKRAAKVSSVPIINAGDGIGEHPTQALLDVYTIYESKGKIDGLKIGVVGDLLNGRTVHSFIQLLSIYKVDLYLLSPKNLQLPQSYLKELDKHSIKYTILNNWGDALSVVDVLYMTRVQKERFKLIEEYRKVKDDFILTLDDVKHIDDDPRAYYFQQVKNGLYVRMALLDHIYSS
jgi:aspartate carbamoyltransferase catalytic subunit